MVTIMINTVFSVGDVVKALGTSCLGKIKQLELVVEYHRKLSNNIREWQEADSSFKLPDKDKDKDNHNKSFIYRFIAEYILSAVKYVERVIKKFFY